MAHISQPINRLAQESSPYLLQHAHNPVDWYPWGPDALALAQAERNPILVSIGYAACHWCHVMERESFKDEAAARVMLSFAPLVQALHAVEARVLSGASLHESLAAFGYLFDARLIALVKVGEEVNRLDYFFALLAQQYGDEVDYRASLLSTALEPVIIVFLGLVVGLILVGMYLPIFQISNTIQ